MTRPVTDIDRLADALITAWLKWDAAPGSRSVVVSKHIALHALRLDVTRAHEAIAAMRRRGYSISDAVQSTINDLNGEAGSGMPRRGWVSPGWPRPGTAGTSRIQQERPCPSTRNRAAHDNRKAS